MNFELQSITTAQASVASVDALIVLLSDEASKAAKPGKDPLSRWVHDVLSSKDLEVGVGKCLSSYRVSGVKARHVVVARSGNGAAASVRKALQAAYTAIKGASCKSVLVFTPDADAAGVFSTVSTLADASYSYSATHSKPKARSLTKVTLGVDDPLKVEAAFERAVAVVRGIELAKEWANRPGNHATPTHLAQAARELGKQPRIRTEVLGPREVAKLGMGAFMAVAKGSEEPLRFIVMKYQGADKSSAPVVLVGKGITFDTGGISIKPAPEMDEMKFDMSGAASVLGTFAALARLQPALNVIGLIPACENMPDGRAVKPGDVVTSMSGQTIEILNTDAEGRLVLCDALTYAQRFKPRAVIDIATLTGACVIALGAVRSGLFASRDELAQHLLEAGEVAMDPAWRMPLDDDYAESLKSNFADMGNVGGRQAGAVTAAKFLQKFVSEQPWAHLDIAGTAWKSGAAKGATGRPVGLLVQYLLDEASRQAVAPPAKSAKASKTTRRSQKKQA